MNAWDEYTENLKTGQRLESFEDEGHVNQFKHGLKSLP